MNLSISRDGKEIGQWTEEQVRSFLSEGKLLLTDHYWKEGMADWLPLSALVKPPPPVVMGQPRQLPRPGPKQSSGCLSVFLKVMAVLVVLAIFSVGGLILAWPSILHALIAKSMEKQMQQTPFMQDENVRVDSITLTPNNVILFHETLVKLMRDNISASDLVTLKRTLANKIRESPNATFSLNLGVFCEVDIYDRNGVSIANVRVTKDDIQ
jgi:hypothetical protein